MFEKNKDNHYTGPKKTPRLRIPKETLNDVITSFIGYLFEKAKDVVFFPFRTVRKAGKIVKTRLCKG